MDDKPDNSMPFPLWFLLIMILLFGLWLAGSGPERESSKSGIFLQPPNPIAGGQTYGESYLVSVATRGDKQIVLPPPIINIEKVTDEVVDFADKIREIEFVHKTPVSNRVLIIDGFAGAEGTTPQSEYIRIVASSKNKSSAIVTGVIFTSSISGKRAVVRKGAKLAIPGTISTLEDIILAPGDRMIVSSGKSPIGTSFQVNICSGYLGQFQTYTPELRRECPRPEDDLKMYGIKDSACEDFLEGLARCEIYQSEVPTDLLPACRQFIKEKINYNSCVALHKNDTGFYRDEWRVFLGTTTEMWRNKQEIIKMLNQKGEVLDAVTY